MRVPCYGVCILCREGYTGARLCLDHKDVPVCLTFIGWTNEETSDLFWGGLPWGSGEQPCSLGMLEVWNHGRSRRPTCAGHDTAVALCSNRVGRDMGPSLCPPVSEFEAVGKGLEKLGQRIRELREEAGHTQAQAAEHVGIDDKHWSDIECGRTNPTVATLVGIARGLDVTLADLFTD